MPIILEALEIHFDIESDDEAAFSRLLEKFTGAWSRIPQEEARKAAEQILPLTEKFKKRKEQGHILRILGAIAAQGADYTQAIRYNEEARLICRELKQFSELITCNNQLGRVYANLGDYSRAIDLFDESLKLAEKNKDTASQANTLNAFSVIYQRAGNAGKAEEMALKSLQLAIESKSLQLEGIARINLGNAYGLKPDWEKAIESWESSIVLFEKTKNEQYMASALGNIGIAYLRLGKLEKAEELVKRCLEVKERLNDVYDIARSLHNLGTIYAKMERMDEALELYKRALSLGDRSKAKSIDVMIYKDLAEALKENGDYKAALDAYQHFHDLEKQLFTADMNMKTQALQHRFEVEKMEKENEIQRLRNIDLAEANEKITSQKETIEQKNKDITASIRYAQRIQDALLPPDSALRHGFSDAFVLYQPRDIVSGDFYWSMISDDAVLFAVADCTGHGVPGALMSVMGAAFLSEIINERGVTDPGEALNLLRLKVITALHSQGEEQAVSDEQLRDGMDIVLCRFEPASGQLRFACANNPLWLLRGGVITEFEADKFPVGLHHGQMQYFRSQKTILEPGDRLFLFTDGYADQFGGPENHKGGKKFGYKRFRELLIESGNLPAEKQKSLLDEKMREWKGMQEQIDDILVVGLSFD